MADTAAIASDFLPAVSTLQYKKTQPVILEKNRTEPKLANRTEPYAALRVLSHLYRKPVTEAHNSQVDDERMFDQQQDLFLVPDVVDLLEANDFGDRQHFEREVFARRSMPRQDDTPERSRSLTKTLRHAIQPVFSGVARIWCGGHETRRRLRDADEGALADLWAANAAITRYGP